MDFGRALLRLRAPKVLTAVRAPERRCPPRRLPPWRPRHHPHVNYTYAQVRMSHQLSGANQLTPTDAIPRETLLKSLHSCTHHRHLAPKFDNYRSRDRDALTARNQRSIWDGD